MKIWQCVHWGVDYGAYHGRLPRTEADALARYQKALTYAKGRHARTSGWGGVTVYDPPLKVLGMVRGVDGYGNPTMYIIAEDDDDASDAGGESGGATDGYARPDDGQAGDRL